jgi:hypothetical protein
MCPSVQGGTQQLMNRGGKHLAVLIRKAQEICQEARRPDVFHPSEPSALNLRGHHPALIDAGIAEPQRPIS